MHASSISPPYSANAHITQQQSAPTERLLSGRKPSYPACTSDATLPGGLKMCRTNQAPRDEKGACDLSFEPLPFDRESSLSTVKNNGQSIISLLTRSSSISSQQKLAQKCSCQDGCSLCKPSDDDKRSAKHAPSEISSFASGLGKLWSDQSDRSFDSFQWDSSSHSIATSSEVPTPNANMSTNDPSAPSPECSSVDAAIAEVESMVKPSASPKPRAIKAPAVKVYREATPNDIIFGRGAGPNAHNHAFREGQVAGRRDAYRNGNLVEKAEIVSELIRCVRDRGGRFLAWDGAANAHYEVTDEAVRIKLQKMTNEYLFPHERRAKSEAKRKPSSAERKARFKAARYT